MDIDGNGEIDPLTDGLLGLRAMFGFTGSDATDGAIGANATRSSWSEIAVYLDSCGMSVTP